MLIALEGSSPTISGGNNYKYYVWDIYKATRQTPKRYIEGPAAISWGPSPVNIRKMANEATAFIKKNSGKIFLVGWSRGAAGCIQVALDLKRANYSKKIDAMFLFDAVDQDGSTSDFLNYVPSNVKTCYHAIATDKSWLDRRIFPTCGKTAASSVKFIKKDFHATHGGIAGAGSSDGGSKPWMWSHLKREGVL